MACDSDCKLKLDETPNSVATATELLSVTTSSAWREYHKTRDGNVRISTWKSLTKGQPYYLEAHHVEYWGNDVMSVGVEIKQTAVTGHHQSTREI